MKVIPGDTRVQSGWDILSNNGVNFVMPTLASLLAMGVAYEPGSELKTPYRG